MNVTVEYMILIPVLILQIFLFPLFVNVAMNQWVDDRRSLELQEAAGYLSSSIQQIYLSLNHTSILGCTLKSSLGSEPFIEGYVYVGNATLQAVSGSDSGSSKVLEITLHLVSTSISTSTSVTLGQNAEWVPSSFTSNSATACIIAEKFPNQTIQLSFGT
jgi:hypothetical protein